MKILCLILLMTSCTDTDRAGFASLGSSGSIICYSGGKIIFEGRSTGKIQSTQQSDGWEFKDDSTGKFTRISGTCIVRN